MGSIIAFKEFYYFGTLHLYATEENYTVIIEGKGKYECETSFCSIKLSPNIYLFEIQKEGFYRDQYSLEIRLSEVTELSAKINRKKEILEWIPASDNNEIKQQGIEFPLSESMKDSAVEHIAVNEKNVLYNAKPIYTLRSPVYISTDEIGRNAWIVSEDEVIGFSQETKNLFPAVKDSITRFYPQANGGFSWKNKEGKLLSFYNGKTQSLNISPLSLFTACSIPNKDEQWVYLAKSETRAIGLFTHDPFLSSTEESQPLVILENIYESDVLSLKCFANNTVKGFLKDGRAFIISF